MKFQKRLEREAPSVLINEEFRSALIRYKALKKHIAAMDTSSVRERNAQPAEGECCICFEPFFAACGMITTTCSHKFHPVCLIDALGTGSCTTCPLCRRSAAGLVPEGKDGDCLRFLAMIKVNINAVQRCHEDILRHLDRQLELVQIHVNGIEQRCLPCLPSERNRLEAEIEAGIAMLEATTRYDVLNYEGFRKIVKKFDKRTGYNVSAAVLAGLQKHGIFQDVNVFGNGRCMRIRSTFERLLRTLRNST